MGVAEAGRGLARYWPILAPWRRPSRRQTTWATDTFGALADAFLAHGRTKRGRPLRPNTVRQYRLVPADLCQGAARPAGPGHQAPAGRGGDRPGRADLGHDQRHAHQGGAVPILRLVRRTWPRRVQRRHRHRGIFDIAKRSRVLTDGELAAIWAATEEPHDFNMIIRLCLWTGCSRGEAGGMRWTEMDNGTGPFPASA